MGIVLPFAAKNKNVVAFSVENALSGSVKPDLEITDLAARQHALITLDQLRSVGQTKEQIRYRVETGRLQRLEPRLFRIGGAVETWEQRVLGACLSVGNGAVACRRTAAVLWELLNYSSDPPIDVAVARPRNPTWSSANVFRSTDIIAAHRTVLDGIPVTTVPRTLVDLGAVTNYTMVEDAVDRALVRQLTTLPDLHQILDNVARQGRRGVGHLRRAIEFLEEGPESVLEMKLLRIILRSSLPRPTVQHWVELGPGQRYRIDIAYPEVKLAIEADGKLAHLVGEAFDRERERQNALENADWKFLRYTWKHARYQEGYVVSSLGDRLRRLCLTS